MLISRPTVRYSSGQGSSTAAILTNRAKHITVISRKPPSCNNVYSDDKKNGNSKIRKGDRPMHRTTLTFEDPPFFQSYQSTTRQAFSGRKDLPRSYRPPRCPSQHTSQFSIGNMTDHIIVPHGEDVLPNSIKQTHEDKSRRIIQMAGHGMKSALTSASVPLPPNRTTYDQSHNGTRKLTHSESTRKKNLTPEKFDLISGYHSKYSYNNDLRLISGNRVLRHIRDNTQEFILG